MKKQIFGIAIYEDEILLSDFRQEDEKRYFVTEEELTNLLRLDTGFSMRPFPGLIRLDVKNKREISYTLTLPKKKRTIVFSGVKERKTYHLEVPAILARVSTLDNVIHINGICGFTGTLTKTSKLYELPFPNGGGGSICLGNNRIEVEDGDVPAAVETALFDTPFNVHRQLVGKESIPFPEYIEKYKGKAPIRTLKETRMDEVFRRDL